MNLLCHYGAVIAVDQTDLLPECTECGRLYKQDHRQEFSAKSPAEPLQGSGVLPSSLGEKWKRPLLADWNDAREEGRKGYISYCGLHPCSGYYSSFEKLEIKYYKQLDLLIRNDILRSARLKYNGEIIHRFW